MDPMEERTKKVEKDDQGRETFRKTRWKCKYPIVGVDGRSPNFNLVYELNKRSSEFTSLILYYLGIPFMVVYTCKKYSGLYYLTPHAFWNITDFGAKCEECVTINTIKLEKGEFKRQILR
jgi:hypothetical protein